MRCSQRSRANNKKRLLAVVLVCFSSWWPALAQDSRGSATTDRGDRVSRAELEAEQLVSLSAEKIIGMLQRETGLLLQVKRALVRKAFEQGRILDPEDLSDEALFRLIREEQAVRAMVTREIEYRSYVRARPTREEERFLANRAMQTAQDSSEASQPAGEKQTSQTQPSQEEAYWTRYDRETQRRQRDTRPPSNSSPPAVPEPYPAEPAPQDSRRILEQANTQLPVGDTFTGLTSDSQTMTRMRPDELPELLRASSLAPEERPGSAMGSERLVPGKGPALPPSSRGDLWAGPTPGPSRPLSSGQLEARANVPGVLPPPSRLPTQPELRHRANPYANIPALYDLYSQYSREQPVLTRFGEDIFRNGTGNFDELPMDVPVGPDYVVGPGDGLSIELWGGISERLQRVVDREGRLALPEVGAVQVNGRSLADVQHLVQGVLRTQFRDLEADVSIARLRTVRVYVVGDVERPGAYDVSSLSTPLNALFLAGGPTSRGSLRFLRHYRGDRLVQAVDVYDLLLHGVRSNVQRLEAGDTVLVPPLGAEVTVGGMVRRPAVYEVLGENSLAEVLELAGGVLPSGTLRHVDVERVVAHTSRTMLRVDLPENNNQESVNTALEDFKVQDGDKVRISPIVAYAEKTVYLDGHVARPGKYAYRDGMLLADLIHSYSDLLPEPSKRHAEVIRLQPPDYTPLVLAFNLSDALDGKNPLTLRPFDTVRIFSRYDFEDPPVVTITGEVREPGDHLTNGVTRLRDAIYLAGGLTPDALTGDAQVFRKTDGSKLKVISVDLGRALAGDEKDNILLEAKDRIFVHRNLARVDPAAVSVEGQVARPGKYPLGENMTAADLVRLAGGLKRGAFTEKADVTRFIGDEEKKAGHISFALAAALAGTPDTDVPLKDGDVVSVGELSGWRDLGASITLTGEVVHPGTYGIAEGERLSSIIARAGGFRADAYAYGAIFERVQVRELEERNRAELIRRVQGEGATLKLIQETDQDQKAAKEASLLQWQSTMERLQNTPPTGRLVIHISNATKRWARTPADIEVRNGDTVFIPKKPNLVMVDGSVYHPTAVTFKPGKSVRWYLSQAGGPTNAANKKDMFVIRADGSVVGNGSGSWLRGGLESAELQAGDVVVVPERAYSGTTKWKTTLQAAQLTSAVGIAIQVARSF
jgi:protein involved in polysaccharide export with SLBB domain